MDENIPHLDDVDWSPYGQAKARRECEGLPIETQQKATRTLQYSLMFSLASFYNFIALIVHGRKLTQLVSEAMMGNNDSFCLAVHIDRNILEQIPYFKDRYSKAQREGEQDFLEALHYRTQSTQLKGRIRHRALYMLFALLERTQLSINTQYFPAITTTLTCLMYCKTLISHAALLVPGKSSMLVLQLPGKF